MSSECLPSLIEAAVEVVWQDLLTFEAGQDLVPHMVCMCKS